LLTTPPPKLDDLGADLASRYSWLADLDSDEQRVAASDPADRSLVLRLLAELPGGRIRNVW
jgi:hypothetical protein